MALAYAVKDRLLHRWVRSGETYLKGELRAVSYLSAEFLIGPQLANNLINLGIYEEVRKAAEELGEDWNALLEHEPEPGLGNGGLGRLAACFLDSLATLEIPSIGYGIRYEFGIFSQSIEDRKQVETTDKWLSMGNPWESHRWEIAFDVKFGGHTEHVQSDDGSLQARWIPDQVVKGVAYDTPVLGYKVNTCSTLRLWKAEATESFDFQAFNIGDYYGAVDRKIFSENITKVLYPNDEPAQGKQLRLEQQYFSPDEPGPANRVNDPAVHSQGNHGQHPDSHRVAVSELGGPVAVTSDIKRDAPAQRQGQRDHECHSTECLQ